MSMMQEKMYMDVDDVCAILGVSKTYAYSLMREYNKELKEKGYICIRRHPVAAFAAVSGHGAERVASFLNQ